MRKLRTWLLVLAAALVGATAPSTPALAAPAATPNAIVTPTGSYGHTCMPLGNDKKTEGVICIAIQVFNLTDGSTRINAVAEAYCQTVGSAAPVQCANATVWFGYVWTDGGEAEVGECGHSFGPCATPRPIFVSSTPLSVPNGLCVQVEGRIWSQLDNGPTTAVQLPGTDDFVRMPNLASTLSTPEFLVGNGC